MLKSLFTSNARIKLLNIFLLNTDSEYFIRELTRKLDEQINSIRRELDNLKKIGLLKSKLKNRKKYYVVNKNFIFFHELKSIIIKALTSKDNIVKKITPLGDINFILMSGVFVEKNSPVDLLIVGNVDREKLNKFLHDELESKRPIKFTVMSKDDFLYRVKCRDKFIQDLLKDSENIIALNKLENELE